MPYWRGDLWSSCFAASTGGATLESVKHYVEDAKEARLRLALNGEVSGAHVRDEAIAHVAH